MTDIPAVLSILEDAKLAHTSGDFVKALRFYEYFFDHALDDDPQALYAVRLSVCLQGWSELATQFPGAKKRLEAKRLELLEQFKERDEAEIFHDYLSVCRELGIEHEAVEQFLSHFHDCPDSAKKLIKYVWDDLVHAEAWSVCNQILTDPEQKLDELFAIYDESYRMMSVDESFNNLRFEIFITDQLLTGLQKLILVLRQGNRTQSIEGIRTQFNHKLQIRDHSELQKRASAQASFLFSGH